MEHNNLNWELMATTRLTAIKALEKQNNELLEALQDSKQIIESLIAGKRVVNLDEALAYYNTLISKATGQD